jgi:hypothetical protein
VKLSRLAVPILLLASAFGAEAPKPKFDMTEIEALRISNSIKDIQLQQIQLDRTIQTYQAILEQTKKAHNWGDNVSFNPQTLQWTPQETKPSIPTTPPTTPSEVKK